MLPSNPRLGPRGLPSNPQPRSREEGDGHRSTTRQRREPRSRSSSRPGKQAERSRTPPLPVSRRQRHEYDKRPQASSSHRSDESTSSVASSLLDRMKMGGGYTSSRTSVEEDFKGPQPDNTTKSLRQKRLPGERSYASQGSEEAPGTGDGYAIWNRVATVASNLTVSVGKAWASHVTTFAGEETPPGEESRLTRAMKAYHLAKARHPGDLPTWLFDEGERRRPVSFSLSPSHGSDDGPQERPQSANAMHKSRGLRDIYDAYRPETPTARLPQRTYNGDAIPSKATDRLKALRDAKRNATGSASMRTSAEETTSDNQPDVKSQGITPRPRVGLPSGPRRV